MKSKSSSQVSLHPTNLNDRVACPGLSYLASNLWFLTMFYFCSKKMTLRTNVGIILLIDFIRIGSRLIRRQKWMVKMRRKMVDRHNEPQVIMFELLSTVSQHETRQYFKSSEIRPRFININSQHSSQCRPRSCS